MNFKKKTARTAVACAALGLALVTSLTGCGDKTENDKAESTTTQEHEASTKTGMHLHDAWVKPAKAGADTAVFGELHNELKEPVTVESGSSTASSSVELHEYIDGKVHQVAGGFKLKADESIDFKPGDNHIMLIKLKKDLKPGDAVEVVVNLSNGSKFTFTAPVKDAPAGDTHKHGEHEHGDQDHDDHDHSDHEH